MSSSDRVRRGFEVLDRLRGLLDQGWFYSGSPPGHSQSESRITECSDLLGLTAELCGDCKRMAEELNQILLSTVGMEIGTETLRKLCGVDLVTLAQMYSQLAEDLAAAGNRALDTIGDHHNGTERQQFAGTQAPESQRLCGSGDERPGQAGEVDTSGRRLAGRE